MRGRRDRVQGDNVTWGNNIIQISTPLPQLPILGAPHLCAILACNIRPVNSSSILKVDS